MAPIVSSDRSIRRLWAGVELFRRELDLEVPSQLISTFLLISMNQGIAVLDLAPKLGLEESSTSRNVFRLTSGKDPKTGKPGYGFVEYREGAEDRRTKNVYLTPKGARFLAELVKADGA